MIRKTAPSSTVAEQAHGGLLFWTYANYMQMSKAGHVPFLSFHPIQLLLSFKPYFSSSNLQEKVKKMVP